MNNNKCLGYVVKGVKHTCDEVVLHHRQKRCKSCSKINGQLQRLKINNTKKICLGFTINKVKHVCSVVIRDSRRKRCSVCSKAHNNERTRQFYRDNGVSCRERQRLYRLKMNKGYVPKKKIVEVEKNGYKKLPEFIEIDGVI